LDLNSSFSGVSGSAQDPLAPYMTSLILNFDRRISALRMFDIVLGKALCIFCFCLQYVFTGASVTLCLQCLRFTDCFFLLF